MKQQTRRPFPLNGNGPIAFEQLGGRLDAETKSRSKKLGFRSNELAWSIGGA